MLTEHSCFVLPWAAFHEVQASIVGVTWCDEHLEPFHCRVSCARQHGVSNFAKQNWYERIDLVTLL